MSTPAPTPGRLRAWLDRWSPLLPILVAEFAILVGFGAVLPILPLYLVASGIDAGLLGVIIAGWPIAKLVFEPVFGYIADRRARRPLMLVALVLLAVATLMPVWLTSAPAFFLARLLGGAAAGMYDPAARGIIVDSTDEERRGEAFGLYSAFQMAGFLLGPALGAAGASIFGGYAFPFLLTAALLLASTAYLAVFLRDRRAPRPGPHHAHSADAAVRPLPWGEEAPGLVADAAREAAAHPAPGAPPGRGLANRLVVAAVVMQLTMSFANGTYEVIWSLFMESLGASVAVIGLTFTVFAIPMMVVSPFAGRIVDRRGGLPFLVGGGLVVAACGLAYTTATEPLLPALVGILEGSAFAFVSPALYWLLARGTPPGRSSTAQGIFGGAGNIGIIVSSLVAGFLWAADPHLPFYFFATVTAGGLLAGWLITRGAPASLRASPAGA